MAARGPPPSLSMPSYPQGGGSGGSADSFRTRGRNRSGGTSGPSSREHSVESRAENRRGLSNGDFRASYNNQYQGPVFEPNRRTSGQNWDYGGEKGSKNSKDFYWRDDSKGVHGRVQGVLFEDDGTFESGSSSRSESSSRGGYSLTISNNEEGRRVSIVNERQDSSYGANRKQSNGSDKTVRQESGSSGLQRQYSTHGSNEGSGGYRRTSQSGSSRARGASVEGRGAVGTSRDLRVPREVVFGDGKELETFGSPRFATRTTKPSGSFLPPPEEAQRHWGRNSSENSRTVKGSTFKGLKEGDLRQSFANDSMGQGDWWRSTSNASSNGSKGVIRDSTLTQTRRESTIVRKEYREDTLQLGDYSASEKQAKKDKSQRISGGDLGRRVQDPHTKYPDGEFFSPSPGSTKRGSSFTRNSNIETEIELSPELGLVSPSSSSTKTFSRKNSFDKLKKRDASAELPVFTPSSESNADTRAESSIGNLSRGSSRKISRENSLKLSPETSLSESATIDLRSVGNEGWNAEKQVPSTAAESASAGMHRTRSTDWYEICLKEEEEEEMQALARKQEQDSKNLKPSSQNPKHIEARGFSRTGSVHQKRGESVIFRLGSVSGGNHRENTNLEKGWLNETLVRGDGSDLAQPSMSGGQRNADAGGKQGLFTPWNALQPVPASRNVSLSVPRSRSVAQRSEKAPLDPRDISVKHENLRVSLAGGRQEARGRRTVNVIDSDVAENWRAERRPSRDYSREIVRSDPPRDSMADSSGRGILKQTNERDRTLPSLVETEKKVPEQTNGREGILVSFAETEKKAPEDLKRVNGSIRPATFYRALNEAMDGDDEALPHVVGTCPDMCPDKERVQRERLRDLAVFERVSGDMRKTSKDLAVKKFCRTVVASELENTDVRPLPVLWRTQQYLLGLLDDPEFSFDIVHNFLFDRTRAIRQELGMQRILDHQTIIIHEEIVRFHILSQHELRDLNRKRSKQIDTHLNLQQLSKSLYSLLNLYISLEGNGGYHSENEAEFYAYYVLLNLGNHGRFQAEPLSLWFPNVPSHVFIKAPMQFARKALRFYRSDNFIGFFRLVKEATYLQASLLEFNFDSVRATALAMLNISEYKLHPYPLSDLAQQLILEEREVDELCMYYGLLTGIDNASQKHCLLAKQGQFSIPEKGSLPQHSCPLIDGKRAPSIYQEVKGSKFI